MQQQRGGTISEFIAARKKAGMTWEDFRVLKAKHDDSQFSDKEMAQYRKLLIAFFGVQQLDADRENRLKEREEKSSRSDKDDKKRKKKKTHKEKDKARKSRKRDDSDERDSRKKKRRHASDSDLESEEASGDSDESRTNSDASQEKAMTEKDLARDHERGREIGPARDPDEPRPRTPGSVPEKLGEAPIEVKTTCRGVEIVGNLHRVGESMMRMELPITSQGGIRGLRHALEVAVEAPTASSWTVETSVKMMKGATNDYGHLSGGKELEVRPLKRVKWPNIKV
ncbi:hypothetical protein HDU93_002077 [Gonapodya sp. JEL0774]|nr:hypothetical protein HDU93_002077 [Gonapodya sp. JEL0774]